MTTANANQFIGSKISLISKSEIRYEGILYSLDLQEATISLAKVKSFGTEDRPTERPVPHKEEIYEFIIFRGADIKGIDVLEPPKATATLTSGLPNDPAIVEVSHYHSSGQSSQPPPSAVGGQGAGYPSALSGSYSQGFGAASSTLLGGVKPVQQGSSELNTSSVEQPSGISVPLESTGSTHDTSRSNASTPSLYSNRKSPTNDAGVQVSNEDKGRNSRQFSNRQGDGRGSRHSSQDRRRQPRQQQGNDRQGGYQPRGRGNFVNNRGGFRGGRGGNRGGYRSQGIIQAQNPPKVTFEDAYDFEKANEELSKLKIKPEDLEKKEGEQEGGDVNNTEEEQENKEPPEPFYVKDSFYDKISCESTERGKGRTARIDWRAERKLNAETFGLPANSGQRRGYQRGGGYRGGFRGGYQGSPRGGYQQRGGYGGYNTGYGYGNNGGWQYNNRYNGGRGNRGGYRQQQQNQPQSQQQPAQ